ncbi:CvpA family protein [Eudoraea sp.]|uniref:CvpA family protein n=1 Tax=Eudoraea sp. TaxID=1979955 RepID=UPI003C72E4C6
MALLDIIFVVFLVYGLYKGLKNGLFVEIASIIALIVGFYGAIEFSYITGSYLSENMDWDPDAIRLTAFIITFIVIVIIVGLAGKLLTKIANFAMLGFINKLAGGIFGILKTAVIFGTLLYVVEAVGSSFNPSNSDMVKESVLYEPIKNIGVLVFGNVIEAFSDF